MSLLTTLGLGKASAGAGGAFVISSIVVTLKQLKLNMSATPIISGPAADPVNYPITTLTGRACHATGVSIQGNAIILATTEQTNGDTYTLNMPTVGLIDVDNHVFQGPFTNNFTGYGVGPTIIMARSIDARTMDIIFSEAVDETMALNAANYSTSPTLTIFSAKKITSQWYQITTSRQTKDQLYTVTITNIDDEAGNPP